MVAVDRAILVAGRAVHPSAPVTQAPITRGAIAGATIARTRLDAGARAARRECTQQRDERPGTRDAADLTRRPAG